MSDLISRQDAIDAIRRTVAQYVPFLNGVNETLPMECEIALRSVPSAEPKTRKWLEIEDYNGDYHYQCSVCKEEFYLKYGTPKENGYAYCPSCGKRMTPYKGGDTE